MATGTETGGPARDHDWISAFLDAQAAEAGAARNTLLAYGRDLKDAAGWLAGQGKGFAAAERPDIEAYLVFCDGQGFSRATRARRLSALRQLYRFAFEEGWRSENPAIQIRGPGRAKTLPKTLSLQEVDALLTAAPHVGRGAAEKLRNTCLMELLYATGMRVSELVSLPVAASRGDPQMLLILGKGGKERMVPLSDPAREALQDWLGARDAAETEARMKGQPESRFLFPSRSAEGHLTRHRFYA
ncbi:MAG: tyrosine-type recombinase/integrase, partial [Rhodobacteraceae bacterium]|nr:tyrosine-type recombinase/integrase [Paracoccaceae bacterium]